jgi:glycosyltransferase involved in cell wall biosynthesis
MHKKPLVSIIVATYKRMGALEKAIESINTQSYKNCEIIIVDDNCDEKYSEKVKKVIDNIESDFHLNYIKNDENMGSAETRNVGIRAAKGEYVTFLDDDDLYLNNKILNQLNFMVLKDLDYSVTDLTLYSENNNLIEYRDRNYIKSTKPEDLLKYHLMNHITGTDTMMFRKEYLIAIGSFAPINVGDEFYLMERAISAGGKFGHLPRCDVKAYVHTGDGGLSSGDNKITGENNLFEYKKSFFAKLTKKEIQYIKMRHYAVLAFAEVRRKRHFNFISYGLLSFLHSPIDCTKLILTRK